LAKTGPICWVTGEKGPRRRDTTGQIAATAREKKGIAEVKLLTDRKNTKELRSKEKGARDYFHKPHVYTYLLQGRGGEGSNTSSTRKKKKTAQEKSTR